MFISVVLGTLSGFVAAPVAGVGLLAAGAASAFCSCGSSSGGGYSSSSYDDEPDSVVAPKKRTGINTRPYIKYVGNGFVIGAN